jgi:hypothetical protein
VIASETVLFPQPSARFLELVYQALHTPVRVGTAPPRQATLAEAMASARRAMIAGLNPLAMSFVAYGNGDLTLTPKETT